MSALHSLAAPGDQPSLLSSAWIVDWDGRQATGQISNKE
jgi:hypothetical protein